MRLGAPIFFDLLAAVGVGIVEIIVLADDRCSGGAIHRLGAGVIGVVDVAGVDTIRQPFLFQPATGIVAIANGAVVRRPDAGEPADGIV